MIIDGAIGTELIDVGGQPPDVEEHLWGADRDPRRAGRVADVHRRYVEVGCDLSRRTRGGCRPRCATEASLCGIRGAGALDGCRAARRAARPRAAAADAGRDDEVAVAFSINGDVDTPDGRETIRLLARAFEQDRPDLILLETLSLVRSSTYATVEALLDTGLPVWLSFRRCRQGVCGVYGEHWGGPEGDAFGRAARRFEEMGVGALAINCVPPDHVTGMLSWLRDFTDLPLGVYPNLGYLSAAGWRHETSIGGDRVRRARTTVARGGRPDHRRLLRRRARASRGRTRGARRHQARTRTPRGAPERPRAAGGAEPASQPAGPTPGAGRCSRSSSRTCTRESGVFVPTQGSLLIWKYLYREGIGAHQRCLDIGCGTGLQTVQLASNGAAHVHAIDIDERTVKNTLTNAFRNGVADRVTAAFQDLYPWVPEERYDVIVASLYQLPVDPFEQVGTHRPLDYWGRNLLDHLIRMLPDRSGRRRHRLRDAAVDHRESAGPCNCSTSSATSRALSTSPSLRWPRHSRRSASRSRGSKPARTRTTSTSAGAR